MSVKVKTRLRLLNIETTHPERVELDKAIETQYSHLSPNPFAPYCDDIVDELSPSQIRQLLREVRRKLAEKERQTQENIRRKRPVPAGVA